MLVNAAKNIEADPRQENTQNVDLMIIQLCARVAEYISILESLHSDPQGLYSRVVLNVS